MTCGELMTKEVASCSPEDRVDTAALLMRDRNIGALPVVGQDGHPLGMITDRDLAITICADAEDSYYKKVKEVMRSPVVCCKENDDVAAVVAAMTEHHIRRLPVIDNYGKLVGIITVDDLARTADPEALRSLMAGLPAAAD